MDWDQSNRQLPFEINPIVLLLLQQMGNSDVRLIIIIGMWFHDPDANQSYYSVPYAAFGDVTSTNVVTS